MNHNKVSKKFQSIRDIPYKIPLAYDEEDNCCTGKHKKLLDFLESKGYETRWRVCQFHWSDIKLPDDVKSIPHGDESTHAFLEVNINNKWICIDATWDDSLKKIFHINEWNDISSAKIAVPYVKLFTPKQSLKIIESETKEVVEKDLSENKEFYKAFNNWLESARH